MFFFRLGLVVFCFFGCFEGTLLAAEGRSEVSLQECFEASLKQSEGLAISVEEVVQAKEIYRQALGSIMPEIVAEASTLKQDQPERQTNFRSTNHAVSVRAHQPIFAGFKEFYGMRQAKTLERALGKDVQANELELYRTVTQTYFEILSIEREVRDIDAQQTLFADRVKDLVGRVRIGRSRKSDVLRAESLQASLKAQEESLRTDLLVAREVLNFLTGLGSQVILKDPSNPPDTVETLEIYLGLLEDRPDIKAQSERTKAAQLAIGVERSGHYPTLGVDGTYYLLHSDTLKDPNRDSMWDIRGSLSLPLFSGGVTQARIRSKQSERRQADFEMARLRRSAEQEIRSLYQTIAANRLRLDALEKATDSSKRNYETQLQDFRLGLVDNLDVLTALTEYQENVRALHRFEFEAKRNYLTLQAAVGRKAFL